MPRDRLSLFVLAGEPSGDRIGGALIAALKRKVELRLSGVGGSALIAEGLTPLFPMADLSVMGFSDVLKRLPKLFRRLGQATRSILASNPDVVVLIDSQVFSATLARRLRKRGYKGTILLYVAPAVWAWKPERAPKLKARFDEVLSVLPFEPAAMVRLDGPPTTYVGHPALRRFPLRTNVPRKGPLLLLPGSREGEIRRTLPLMRAVAEQLRSHPRVTALLLPTPPAMQERLAAITSAWGLPIQVVSTESKTLKAFSTAVAAVAVTGTVALELALSGVPMVTTYVADAGQAKRFARYKVKFVALPNIILDREVVPEMLFTTPEPERLVAAVRSLLDHPSALQAQFAAFVEMRSLMEKGAPEAPLHDPAERVLAALQNAQRSMIGT